MNNSKKVSIKTTSAIFLAIVLVAGTIVAIFPFMGVAQAQPYYGMDNNNRKLYGNDNYFEPQYPSSYDGKENYKSSKDSSSSKKSVNINKLKCINNNININGNNTGDINLGNKGKVAANANAEEGYSGAYSSSGDEGYYNGYNKKDKGFDCIINNNNTNTNVSAGGSNQTIPPGPGPELTTGNLTVTKNTECNLTSEVCNSPPNPQITVSGNNPIPTSFPASDTPVVVTLEAGPYSVNEEGFIAGQEQCTASGYQGGQQISGNIYMCTNFSTDCAGDIIAGQQLSCNIENNVIDSIAQLTVTKNTECNTEEFGELCETLDPQIIVAGNNPTPNEFSGSQTPVVVTLVAGGYSVFEQQFTGNLFECASQGFEGGHQISGNIFMCTNFSDDCAGSISAGQQLSCTIDNTVIETTIAQLLVEKINICDPDLGIDCSTLDPQITVSGNNPTPNEFSGSQTPIFVILEAGPYSVDETGFTEGLEPCSSLGFDGGQNIGGNNFICTDFSAECEGEISVTQILSCQITNTIVVAVEICDNGIDDDGDGLTDSEDPDCPGPAALTASNINTDNTDFGPMMTLPTPSPSMETFDR